jgi:hypothetical protein
MWGCLAWEIDMSSNRVVRILAAAFATQSLLGCGARSGLLEVSAGTPGADAGAGSDAVADAPREQRDAASDPAGERRDGAPDGAGGSAGTGLDGGPDVVEAGADAKLDSGADVMVLAKCPPDSQYDLLVSGAPCATPGQLCTYHRGKQGPCDDVGTDDLVAWKCERGEWLEIARCVDQTGCPQAPPQDGASCAASSIGLDCFYSSEAFAPSSIAQCEGLHWRHVNALDGHSLSELCWLEPTLSQDKTRAAHAADQNVGAPALALAGTQMLLAYDVSGGSSMHHAVHAHLVQTAVPWMAADHASAMSEALGRDCISTPHLGQARARFVLGWGANDGWPETTANQPGVFVRPVPLHQPPGADALVDPGAVAVTALSTSPNGGWIGMRSEIPGNETKHRASVMALDANGMPVAGSAHVVADESASAGMVVPVRVATVAIARRGDQGFVMAAPAPATGDFWDDSGVLVWFFSSWEPAFAPTSMVRVVVGAPERVAVAALRDGTAVVIYATPDGASPQGAGLPRSVRVWPDGKQAKLPDLQLPSDGYTELRAGPRVVAFDDGFAAVFTRYPYESPGPVPDKLMVAVGDGSNWGGTGRTWETKLGAASPSRGLAIGASEVDRTLHLAWELPSSGGIGAGIHRQRLVCQAKGIK